ncbi:MAG: hypothetical protein KGJ13_05455 [Patescibacteria group bacterium]|nr:hypothetical protein [Patescibacteria group bacterium]
MSAIENMVRALLRHLNIDEQELKKNVIERVQQFEAHISTLNSTLIAHHEALARIERSLERIEQYIVSTANERENNVRPITGTPNSPSEIGAIPPVHTAIGGDTGEQNRQSYNQTA